MARCENLDCDVARQLRERGHPTAMLGPDGEATQAVTAAFLRAFPMGRGGDIDWPEGSRVTVLLETDAGHVGLYDETCDEISAHVAKRAPQVYYVIAHDANSPILCLSGDSLASEAAIVLEIFPVWIVSVSYDWCLEWRGASHVSIWTTRTADTSLCDHAHVSAIPTLTTT